MTSCAVKSRRDGEERMSESDSAAKLTNIENDHTHPLCISVTQCNYNEIIAFVRFYCSA